MKLQLSLMDSVFIVSEFHEACDIPYNNPQIFASQMIEFS